MGNSDNWPLPAEVEEKIESEQVKIHEKYWPELSALDSSQQNADLLSFASMVGKPAPLARQPIKLSRILREYSVELFQVAAKRYPRGPRLEDRLRNLGTWIIDVVMERSTKHLPNLRYHLSEDLMRQAMVESIVEKIDSLLSNAKPARVSPKARKDTLAKHSAVGLSDSRRAIKDIYFAKFPQTMIIDVCWAARQHRREWDKWIKGQVKDGSKPDRLFRWVLTSNKATDKLRPEPREKDWK